MITTERTPDYVVNRMKGPVTIRELLEYAQTNVELWLTEPVLWDLTYSTLAEDESDYKAVRETLRNIHELAELRKGRRTAFLAPDPLTYGMLRMAITIVECVESHFIASVFKNAEEADAWLTRR